MTPPLLSSIPLHHNFGLYLVCPSPFLQDKQFDPKSKEYNSKKHRLARIAKSRMLYSTSTVNAFVGAEIPVLNPRSEVFSELLLGRKEVFFQINELPEGARIVAKGNGNEHIVFNCGIKFLMRTGQFWGTPTRTGTFICTVDATSKKTGVIISTASIKFRLNDNSIAPNFKHDPYWVISYSSGDTILVKQMMLRLHAAGIKTWFGGQIDQGNWMQVWTAQAGNATGIIYCISESFAKSRFCQKELLWGVHTNQNMVFTVVERFDISRYPSLQMAMVSDTDRSPVQMCAIDDPPHTPLRSLAGRSIGMRHMLDQLGLSARPSPSKDEWRLLPKVPVSKKASVVTEAELSKMMLEYSTVIFTKEKLALAWKVKNKTKFMKPTWVDVGGSGKVPQLTGDPYSWIVIENFKGSPSESPEKSTSVNAYPVPHAEFVQSFERVSSKTGSKSSTLHANDYIPNCLFQNRKMRVACQIDSPCTVMMENGNVLQLEEEDGEMPFIIREVVKSKTDTYAVARGIQVRTYSQFTTAYAPDTELSERLSRKFVKVQRKQEELSWDDLITLLTELKGAHNGQPAAVVFAGYGSKLQYRSIDDCMHELMPIVQFLDKKFGLGGWYAIFDGEECGDDGRSTLAHVMRRLQLEHDVRLVAIQAKVVKETDVYSMDAHVDYVYYYDTQYNAEDCILWAGRDKHGIAQGSTRCTLEQLGLNKGLVYGLVALGGGNGAFQEASFAFEVGMRVAYIPCDALNPRDYGKGSRGPLHDYFVSLSESGRIPTECIDSLVETVGNAVDHSRSRVPINVWSEKPFYRAASVLNAASEVAVQQQLKEVKQDLTSKWAARREKRYKHLNGTIASKASTTVPVEVPRRLWVIQSAPDNSNFAESLKAALEMCGVECIIPNRKGKFSNWQKIIKSAVGVIYVLSHAFANDMLSTQRMTWSIDIGLLQRTILIEKFNWEPFDKLSLLTIDNSYLSFVDDMDHQRHPLKKATHRLEVLRKFVQEMGGETSELDSINTATGEWALDSFDYFPSGVKTDDGFPDLSDRHHFLTEDFAMHDKGATVLRKHQLVTAFKLDDPFTIENHWGPGGTVGKPQVLNAGDWLIFSDFQKGNEPLEALGSPMANVGISDIATIEAGDIYGEEHDRFVRAYRRELKVGFGTEAGMTFTKRRRIICDRHPHTVDGTQYYLMRDFWHDAEISRIVPTDYELHAHKEDPLTGEVEIEEPIPWYPGSVCREIQPDAPEPREQKSALGSMRRRKSEKKSAPVDPIIELEQLLDDIDGTAAETLESKGCIGQDCVRCKARQARATAAVVDGKLVVTLVDKGAGYDPERGPKVWLKCMSGKRIPAVASMQITNPRYGKVDRRPLVVMHQQYAPDRTFQTECIRRNEQQIHIAGMQEEGDSGIFRTPESLAIRLDSYLSAVGPRVLMVMGYTHVHKDHADAVASNIHRVLSDLKTEFSRDGKWLLMVVGDFTSTMVMEDKACLASWNAAKRQAKDCSDANDADAIAAATLEDNAVGSLLYIVSRVKEMQGAGEIDLMMCGSQVMVEKANPQIRRKLTHRASTPKSGKRFRRYSSMSIQGMSRKERAKYKQIDSMAELVNDPTSTLNTTVDYVFEWPRHHPVPDKMDPSSMWVSDQARLAHLPYLDPGIRSRVYGAIVIGGCSTTAEEVRFLFERQTRLQFIEASVRFQETRSGESNEGEGAKSKVWDYVTSLSDTGQINPAGRWHRSPIPWSVLSENAKHRKKIVKAAKATAKEWAKIERTLEKQATKLRKETAAKQGSLRHRSSFKKGKVHPSSDNVVAVGPADTQRTPPKILIDTSVIE